MSAVTGRRSELLLSFSARGGAWPLADVQALYRRLGWDPAAADADLAALVRAGDLAVTGQAAARTWEINLSGLIGGAP